MRLDLRSGVISMSIAIAKDLTRENILDLPADCVSDSALMLPPGLTYVACQNIGVKIGRVEKACPWWSGDWVNYIETTHSAVYSQLLDCIDGIPPATLHVRAWVAQRIEPNRRKVDLSWSHHRAVAKLGPTDQDRWLAWAVTNNATAAVLQEAVREERIADGLEQPRPSATDKEAVKFFSINTLGQPWTVDSHNTLMTYLSIDHYLKELTD